jgi:hypothetical protein
MPIILALALALAVASPAAAQWGHGGWGGEHHERGGFHEGRSLHDQGWHGGSWGWGHHRHCWRTPYGERVCRW